MLMINDFFLNSNETELKEKSASSSSFKTVIILDNKKLLDEQTEDSFVLKGETPRLKDEEISYVDKLMIR